jgi:hypothetical protein
MTLASWEIGHPVDTVQNTVWSFSTGSAPPPGFIIIDPNNGAIDDWSSVPVLRDDPNDDSTYGTDLRYEIDKVWAGNNASPPTEFYFRVDYLGAATSANLYRVRFDCNRNGSFSDAVDVYVDYSPEIDIVVQYQGSGGPGEYYPPPEAFGEAFGTGPSSCGELRKGQPGLGRGELHFNLVGSDLDNGRSQTALAPTSKM